MLLVHTYIGGGKNLIYSHMKVVTLMNYTKFAGIMNNYTRKCFDVRGAKAPTGPCLNHSTTAHICHRYYEARSPISSEIPTIVDTSARRPDRCRLGPVLKRGGGGLIILTHILPYRHGPLITDFLDLCNTSS
jgi:hypothetical protein